MKSNSCVIKNILLIVVYRYKKITKFALGVGSVTLSLRRGLLHSGLSTLRPSIRDFQRLRDLYCVCHSGRLWTKMMTLNILHGRLFTVYSGRPVVWVGQKESDDDGGRGRGSAPSPMTLGIRKISYKVLQPKFLFLFFIFFKFFSFLVWTVSNETAQ